MAHALGKKLNISPERALHEEVERTAGGVSWLDEFLQGIDDPAELLPSGKHGEYVALWQKERAHLMRVTSAAINAGVIAKINQREYDLVAVMVGVLKDSLAELDLPNIDAENVRGRMKEKLHALDEIEEAKRAA